GQRSDTGSIRIDVVSKDGKSAFADRLYSYRTSEYFQIERNRRRIAIDSLHDPPSTSHSSAGRDQCQSDIADVSVEDADGRAVLDLRAQDFEIIENGRATPVTHSSLEVDPIDVAFAIDRSSSIAAEGKRWKRPSGSC